MKVLNASAVSYLNTKPFLYGIFRSVIDKKVRIKLDIPSECARKLVAGEVDLGLIPVVAIAEMEKPIILSDYCIGADGPVKTVMIYSDVPIEKVKQLYMDYHSRTSVKLAEILIRDYWKLDIEYLPTESEFFHQIGGETAGLVIGDRTFSLANRFEYQYDLAEYWKKMTGLPFVFAAWVSRKPLPKFFLRAFNDALADGVSLIPKLVDLLPTPTEDFDLATYFNTHIQYELDIPKRKALSLFLKKINHSVGKELTFL